MFGETKNRFEKNKFYRFIPTKTESFKYDIKEHLYKNSFIWQLDVKNPVFMVKRECNTVTIDGYSICKLWCEEVK